MSRTHTVSQGECLSSIAKVEGLPPAKIYEDGANSDFREACPNPNILRPGAKLEIPEAEAREEGCDAESKHRFRCRIPSTRLRCVIQDDLGEPLGDRSYRLECGDLVAEDKTDGDGLVDQLVPADAQEARLVVWPDDADRDLSYSWTLKVGWLDPVGDLTGVQARLNNLGFEAGPVDGINGPLTKRAVRIFQSVHDLTVDGIPGPQTQGRLEEVHGC